MLKTNVNEYEFRDMFNAIRPDNFSYSGLGALFEYLEDLSEDIGEDMEVDVIGICCEFTEYESLADFNQEYYGNDSDRYITDIEELRDHTQVIEFYGFNRETCLKTNAEPSIIVQEF